MTKDKRVLSIGCGFYGEKVIKRLAASDVFSDIVIGEIDAEKARKAAEPVAGSGKNISTVDVDATSIDSLPGTLEKGEQLIAKGREL